MKIRRRGYPAQTRTFETKAAAERYARQIERELDQGVFVSRTEAENTTLGDLLNRYLEEVTKDKKGAGAETYRIQALRRHPLATRIVATIRGTDIAAYRDERLQQVTPATVKRELVILGHLFKTARKEWSIHMENPVRMIRPPGAYKPRERHLQAGEEERLYDSCRAANNAYLYPVVRLALETAMRQSELANLRWDDVNLNRRIANLPDTKNSEARAVPLSTAAVGVLESLPRSLDGEVFPRVTAEAIKRAFARAVRRAGIDNLRFHDLRHEATSRLFECGLNIMEVSTITGHKDLSMLKRYAHLRAEDLAKKLG